jgi:O-antigen ligase
MTGLIGRLWAWSVDRPLILAAGAAILIQGLVFVAAQRFDFLAVVAIALLVVAAPVLFASVPRTLAALVFVIMIVQAGRTRLEFMPIGYTPALALPFLGIGFFHLIRSRLDRHELSWPAPGFGLLWIGLFLWAGFAAITGLARDAEPGAWKLEISDCVLYSTFILAAGGLTRPRHFRLLLATIVAGLVVVAVQYVAALLTGAAGFHGTGRVITQQANLVVLVAPFLIVAFASRLRGGTLWLMGLVPAAVVVLLSQQRMLFLAVPVSVLTACALGLRHRVVSLRRVALIVAALAAAVVVAWGLVGSLEVSGSVRTVGEGLAERTGQMSDAQSSPSLIVRLVSFAYVWEEKIKARPITGWGLGDVAQIPILRLDGMRETLRVDNSYLTLLWKSGAVGLALFLLLYGITFVRALRLANHPNAEARVLAIGVASALIGILLLATASTLITHYPFNAIWGVLLGAVPAAERAYSAPR